MFSPYKTNILGYIHVFSLINWIKNDNMSLCSQNTVASKCSRDALECAEHGEICVCWISCTKCIFLKVI